VIKPTSEVLPLLVIEMMDISKMDHTSELGFQRACSAETLLTRLWIVPA